MKYHKHPIPTQYRKVSYIYPARNRTLKLRDGDTMKTGTSLNYGSRHTSLWILTCSVQWVQLGHDISGIFIYIPFTYHRFYTRIYKLLCPFSVSKPKQIHTFLFCINYCNSSSIFNSKEIPYRNTVKRFRSSLFRCVYLQS